MRQTRERSAVAFACALAVATQGACGSDAGVGADGDGPGDTTPPEVAIADGVEVDVPDSTQPACLGPTVTTGAGTDRLAHALGVATVTIEDRDTCTRTYRLTSTATRRDDLPASPRTFVERAGDPVLRSGHDLLDALHALALDELHEAAVDTIRDGAFGGGADTSCGPDGCWETGRKWTYVWTRDTAFAIDLGLAAIDPARAASSLAFKLSTRRDGSELQVVQDTGSGGSWPVSSDRVVWALGARAVLLQLDGDARTTFRDRTLEALAGTLTRDREVVFDRATGLYRGETSFLDWREQTYAAWTQHDVIDIATGAALGTNLLHLHSLRLAAELADEVGDPRASTWSGWAEALRTAIRARFWLPAEETFASFLPSALDPAPIRRFDALALALVIEHGVATPEEGRAILSRYPHYGPGVPVIWPQQQFTPIYHNRAEWPFVDAYWLRAARVARHDAVTDRMVRALVRGAALNLTHLEAFEAATGSPWLVDDLYSGPVVSSQRQLWSIGGFISMLHRSIFGLEPTATGLRVSPWLTHGLRRDLFAGSDQLVLSNLLHRSKHLTLVVGLPPLDRPGLPGGGGALRVARRVIDGVPLLGGDEIPEALLHEGTRIDVALEHDPDVPASVLREADPTAWRELFGPRTPQIKGVTADAGKLRLELATGGEDAAEITLNIYRDGARVAADLPGTTTSWVDPTSDATAARSPCYTLEATFTSSGNASQHARATCWWGASDEAIQTVAADRLEAVGGTLSEEYGRPHTMDWGDPGHTLTARGLRAARSGPHLVQVAYGNGAGPMNTGIACGLKRVRVVDEANDQVVGEGFLVMPQLGRWDRWAFSSFVPVTLDAARTYRVVITADAGTANMSDLAHFATYTGAVGGRDGPMGRVNIAELRLLAR